MIVYVVTKTKEMSDEVETVMMDDLEAAAKYCISKSSYHFGKVNTKDLTNDDLDLINRLSGYRITPITIDSSDEKYVISCDRYGSFMVMTVADSKQKALEYISKMCSVSVETIVCKMNMMGIETYITDEDIRYTIDKVNTYKGVDKS